MLKQSIFQGLNLFLASVTLSWATLLLSSGCGNIRKGGSTLLPNDPVPAYPVVAQGFFIGLNGQTVSGTAVVYAAPGATSSVLRLEGVIFPNEAGLLIKIKAGVLPIPPIPLRATTGYQNYTVGVPASQTWDYVTIYSQATVRDYAQAFLR